MGSTWKQKGQILNPSGFNLNHLSSTSFSKRAILKNIIKFPSFSFFLPIAIIQHRIRQQPDPPIDRETQKAATRKEASEEHKCKCLKKKERKKRKLRAGETAACKRKKGRAAWPETLNLGSRRKRSEPRLRIYLPVATSSLYSHYRGPWQVFPPPSFEKPFTTAVYFEFIPPLPPLPSLLPLPVCGARVHNCIEPADIEAVQRAGNRIHLAQAS